MIRGVTGRGKGKKGVNEGGARNFIGNGALVGIRLSACCRLSPTFNSSATVELSQINQRSDPLRMITCPRLALGWAKSRDDKYSNICHEKSHSQKSISRKSNNAIRLLPFAHIAKIYTPSIIPFRDIEH